MSREWFYYLTPIEHALYTKGVPEKFRKWYERRLVETPRFQGLPFTKKIPEFTEALDEHVTGLFKINREIGILFPEMKFLTDDLIVHGLFLAHDASEAFSQIGDVSINGVTRDKRDGIKRKNAEPLFFKRYLLPSISDPILRCFAEHIYTRYMQHDPDDLQANYVTYLDRLTGNITCRNKVILPESFNNEEQKLRRSHVNVSVERLVEAASSTILATDIRIRPVITSYTNWDINGWHQLGYEEAIKPIVQEWEDFENAIWGITNHQVGFDSSGWPGREIFPS